MPRYDLAGNPLPDDNPSPQYPGNPMPQQGMGAPGAYPGAPPAQQQFDLAGNPIPNSGPMNAAPAAPAYGQPMGGAAPPYGQPMGAPQYGGPPPGIQRSSAGLPVIEGPDKKKQKVYVGIAAAVVGVFIAYVLIQNALPANVPTPVLNKTYTSHDNKFSVLQPEGWDVKDSADINIPGVDKDPDSKTGGVKFTQGTAYFDLTLADAADQKSAALLEGSGTGEDALMGSGALVHYDKVLKNRMEAGYRNYQDIETQKTSIPGFGEAIGHSWTASGHKFGLPAALKGYRVTMMDWTYSGSIVCEARESNWSQLNKSFQDMINSVRLLGPKGKQPGPIGGVGGGAGAVPGM